MLEWSSARKANVVSGLLLRLRAGKPRGTWNVDLATVRLTEGKRVFVGLAVRRYGACSLSWRCGVCLPVRKAGVLVVNLLTSWLVCWTSVAIVIFLQIWLNVG